MKKMVYDIAATDEVTAAKVLGLMEAEEEMMRKFPLISEEDYFRERNTRIQMALDSHSV